MTSALSDKEFQIKLLKELYYADNQYLSEESIKKRFNEDKVAYRVLESLRGRYIKSHEHNNTKGYELKTEGIDYLFREEEKIEQEKREKEILDIQQENSKREKENLKIQQETANINKQLFLIQLGTLIILAITAYAAIHSTDYARISAEAAKESAKYSYLTYNLTLDSMVPNYADIEISDLDDGRIFYTQTLADNQSHNDLFQVCVTNYGSIDSGPVKLGWVNEEGYFNTPPCSIDLPEIPAKTTRCDSLCIRYYGLNESEVPTGNVSLKLELSCSRCNKQSEYHEYKIINACVISNKWAECSGW